jgi:hypothetical protein
MRDDPMRLILLLPRPNRIVTRGDLHRTAKAAKDLQFHNFRSMEGNSVND